MFSSLFGAGGLSEQSQEPPARKVTKWTKINMYVVIFSAWYLVEARTKTAAKKDGIREFGNSIKSVRLATDDEASYYLSVLKHEIDEAKEW
jgi:hypothetical protein